MKRLLEKCGALMLSAFLFTILIPVQASAIAQRVDFFGVQENEIILDTVFITADVSIDAPADSIAFYLNDEFVNEDLSAPFVLGGDTGLDTTMYPDGLYTLRAVAQTLSNEVVTSMQLQILNVPRARFTIKGLEDNEIIAGLRYTEAVFSGNQPDYVVSYIDEQYVNTEYTFPFNISGWNGIDTKVWGDGAHDLEVVSYYNGAPYSQTLRFYADNGPPVFDFSGLIDGSTVSGVFPIETVFSSAPPDYVDYYLDDEYINREFLEPFLFYLGSGFNTLDFTEGWHTLRAHAYRDIFSSESEVSFFVQNVPTPYFSFEGLLADEEIEDTLYVEVFPENGPPDRIEFFIDDVLVDTQNQAPYDLASGRGFDTNTIFDGAHTLKIVATDDIHVVEEVIPFTVDNSIPPDITFIGPDPFATVSGNMSLEVLFSRDLDRLEFYVGDQLINVEYQAPYEFSRRSGFDTTTVEDGFYNIKALVYYAGTKQYEEVLPVTIDNVPDPDFVVSGLVPDQEVTGMLDVLVTEVFPEEPVLVEFLIDSETVRTEIEAPYTLVYDTNLLEEGEHVLDVYVEFADSSSVVKDINFYVNNDLPEFVFTGVDPLEEVFGTIYLQATFGEGAPEGVDFYVNGNFINTEHFAPYDFSSWRGFDTNGLADGVHEFVAIATLNDVEYVRTLELLVYNTINPTFDIVGLIEGEEVSGVLYVQVENVFPEGRLRIDFFVDDVFINTEHFAPYDFSSWRGFDTNGLADGVHELKVEVSVNGQLTTKTVSFVTVNE